MQTGLFIGWNWDRFGLVMAVLALVAIAYDAWITSKGSKLDGYVAFLVVGGVLLTLGGLAVLSLEAALLALACFAASGLPMVLGYVRRYVDRRERIYRGVKAALAHDKDDDGDAA